MKIQNQEILLWETDIPGEIESPNFKTHLEIENGNVIWSKNVTKPTLTAYLPEDPNGKAVLILPGGGYHHVSIKNEGVKPAKWLNSLGITAFVLNYRLPNDTIMVNKTLGPLQDAQKAMRYIRRNAKKYDLNASKLGVLGFSAGGHLAATLSNKYKQTVYTENENISAKPNFSILVYPVISMEDDITHHGSKNKLLGDNPSEEKIKAYSLDKQVTAETPATFLVHATNDKSVAVENSLNYYLALKTFNVPVEMHLYENGGHAFGLGNTKSNKNWPKACELWLEQF